MRHYKPNVEYRGIYNEDSEDRRLDAQKCIYVTDNQQQNLPLLHLHFASINQKEEAGAKHGNFCHSQTQSSGIDKIILVSV